MLHHCCCSSSASCHSNSRHRWSSLFVYVLTFAAQIDDTFVGVWSQLAAVLWHFPRTNLLLRRWSSLLTRFYRREEWEWICCNCFLHQPILVVDEQRSVPLFAAVVVLLNYLQCPFNWRLKLTTETEIKMLKFSGEIYLKQNANILFHWNTGKMKMWIIKMWNCQHKIILIA